MQDEFLFEIDEDGEVTEVQDSIGDMEEPGHYDNLVDYLKSTPEGQAALADIGRIVVEQTNQEIAARDDWEQTNVKGLDQIGVKMEETSEPFDGACTVTHPLLLESAVKFQAKAIVELFPPGGPTKTQIMGKVDMAKENVANIVKDYMNYLLTEKMEEYFDEEERIYYYSALVGSAFSKVIYSLQMKRPIREFVPATDFIISNDTTSIRTAFGYTHRVRKAEHALLDLIADGVYANVLDDLGEPKLPKLSEFEEKANSLTGIDPTVADSSKCYTLYERHMYYSIPGLEVEKNGVDILVPYIFTVDADTQTVLAVRRNWAEGDPNYVKEEYFTHYPFVPGLGFYGYGYIALLGNLNRTVTTALRQLIDAGTFANLQGGFKLRGTRITDNRPIKPGEWRDIESSQMDIGKALHPLPYKEPSVVLFELVKYIAGAGQKFADSTEQVVADMANSQTKTGATLAMLEASTKFFSAIHKRMYKAKRDEFRIIRRLLSIYLDDGMVDLPEQQFEVKAEYFNDGINIIPVADPNIPSQAHRLSQVMTQMELARQAPPGQYNMVELHRKFLTETGLSQQEILAIMPPPQPPPNQDPLSDIMSAVKGQPIGAYPGQDHDAHIGLKSAWLNDPMNGANELMKQPSQMIAANIREHMALKYQEQVGGLVMMQGPQDDPQFRQQILIDAGQKIMQTNKFMAEMGQMEGIAATGDLAIKSAELALEKQKLLDNKDIKSAELAVRNRDLDIKEKKLQTDTLLKGAEIDQKQRENKADILITTSQNEAAERRALASEETKRLALQARSDDKKEKSGQKKKPKA